MNAPTKMDAFQELVQEQGGKVTPSKIKIMADRWKPILAEAKNIRYYIDYKLLGALTLAVIVIYLLSLMLPQITATKPFRWFALGIGETATFIMVPAVLYAAYRTSSNLANGFLFAISLIHILSWSVIAAVLKIASNTTFINDRMITRNLEHYGGGHFGDMVGTWLVNGAFNLLGEVHPAMVLPTAFMLLSSIFLGNPLPKFATILHYLIPEEQSKKVGEIKVQGVKNAEKKPDNNIAELLNIYGLDGATHKKTITGPIIQREIIKIPRGSDIGKIQRNMKNMKRDIGQSLIINPFVKGHTGCVSVDIPNEERQNVNYQELYDSKQFQRSKAAIPLILGKDTQGRIIVKDMATMPHLLIAGTSGSGKTSAIHSIICSLSMKYSPSYLKFQIIDMKMLDMAFYDNLPHLAAPTAYTFEEAYQTAKGIRAEMQRRKQLMAEAGCIDIKDYNNKNKQNSLPYILFIIDEIASIFIQEKVADPETPEKRKQARDIMLPTMNMISQQARAFGIHMLPATQKPSKTAIPSDFQANISERICLTVTDEENSKYIINNTSAAYLLKKGDGMYYDDTSGEYERIHMPFLDAKNGDLDRVINQIKQKWGNS